MRFIAQRIHDDAIEQVMINRPLLRILEARRRSIDDVVNDPIAKRDVQLHFKLSRWIDRQMDTRDLERQWNPNAL